MSDKNFMNWAEKYSVGIPEIDQQHQTLFKMLNNLFIESKRGEQHANTALKTTVKGLVDYVKFHFNTEEELLTKYKYPDEKFQLQKKEHKEFIVNILNTVKDFEDGKKYIPSKTIEYLKEWVLHHIAIVDKDFSNFLQEKMGIK